MATATTAGGQAAIAVATTRLTEGLGEGALRTLGGKFLVTVQLRETQGRRERTEGFESHLDVSGLIGGG